MLGKARLVKKESVEKTLQPTQGQPVLAPKRERVLLTQQIVQTTKDWLGCHRQQQKNARQTFAGLFVNADTQSNAI
jgi:hypothetical protein